jgi:hypothetical protein
MGGGREKKKNKEACEKQNLVGPKHCMFLKCLPFIEEKICFVRGLPTTLPKSYEPNRRGLLCKAH